LERAVFVLRRAFNWPYDEIGEILGRSPEAIRQLDHRAREHLKQRPDRFVLDAAQVQIVTERFLNACIGGSVEGLLELLSPEVVLHSDSGGEAKAPPKQIIGAAKVARFFVGITHSALTEAEAHLVDINGMTGVLSTIRGAPVSAVTFDLTDGRISDVYLMAAPSKLQHLHRRHREP
jgi:RNA polymerase sigma-70 factor (ECF subfamily)